MNVIPTMEAVITSVRTVMAASPVHVAQGMNLNLEMTVTSSTQDDCVKVFCNDKNCMLAES